MKKILIFSVLAFVLSSCTKLNLKPVDAYSSSTFFTTKDAALSNLAAVYSKCDLSGFWEDGDAIEFDDITDNGYNPFTNQLPHYIALGTATPSLRGKYNDLYREYFSQWGYQGVRAANYFLENIDNVTMDTVERRQMKGEAIFLRAAVYARMMMTFGGVPLVTKVLNYGDENKIPRSTEAQTASFVESQLAVAANDLPVTIPSGEAGRATKGAALALKARVELFEKDYKDAATDSKAVMDLGIYGLCSNYEHLFMEKYQGTYDRDQEVIFEVRYNYANWQSGVAPFYTAPEGGWNSVEPTQSLVDAYETTNGKSIKDDPTYDPDHPYLNRDPRFYATILYPGEHWNGRIYDPLESVSPYDEYYNSPKGNRSRTGYGLRKWCAPADSLLHNPSDYQGIDFIVIRYAEVLLTYAESLIELNQDLPAAAAAINQVRARVHMPPVTATDQAGLRAAVRYERRVEFAFEGLRWYDMKRWKIGEQVMNGPVYGVRPGHIDLQTGVVTWSSPNHITVGPNRVFTARDYYFPIPQEDIDVSPILKQNPGW